MRTRDGVLGKKLLSVAAVPGTGDLVFLYFLYSSLVRPARKLF